MSEFVLARNRDAWFVFRGFKYQVDLSILQWLTLTENQEIALESGEDIDIVNRALTKLPTEADRELQQIKHLDKPISLRFPACIIAIANAVQHSAANRSLNLIFRFCTNSTVTVERPSLFDDRCSGISVWTALRAKSIQEPERSNRLARIIASLTASKKPTEGIDERTWKQFQEFLAAASVDEFDELVQKFEWSTQQPAADDVSQQIMQQLQSTRKVTSEQARQIYPRLFLHVMQVLSKPGEKRLTLQSLEEVVKLPAVSELDSTLLEFISSELLSHSARLDLLETRDRQHGEAIAELRNKILKATFGNVVSPHLSMAITEITTALPPQVNSLAKRVKTVLALKSVLIDTDWMAVFGSVGSGKTQLLSLLGEQIPPLIYVSLLELTASEADLLLHHLFLQLCGNAIDGSLTNSGLLALPCGTTIILDNVPRFGTHDRICARLISIAQQVRSRNQHLITISHFPISPDVRSSLNRARFAETHVPPFDVDEIIDLFQCHGAKAGEITREIADAFLASTQGNPTLLTAIARSIQSAGWGSVHDHCRLLEERVASGEVVQQTMFRLLGSVESTTSRELLYRLCVVIGEFGSDEITAVSKAAPELVRPLEAFTGLYGLWVEKRSENLSTVSPLISAIGAEQLAKDVMHRVSDALADVIFDKQLVSPIDFVKGLNYLKRAKSGTKLGMHVLKGMEILSNLPEPWQRLIYTVCSSEGFLDECPVPLHLLIISQQIQIASDLGMAISPIYQLASGLMARAEKNDLWAVFGYAINAAPIVAEQEFDEGLRLCRIALEAIDEVIAFRNSIGDVSESIGKEFAIGLEGALPWFITTEVNSAERFMKWFSLITDRPVWRTVRTFEADLARQGMLLLLDRLWMSQNEIPAHRRAFGSALAVYEAVEGYCRKNGLRLFQALAVRSRIIVYAEYLRDLERAVETSDAFLSSGENTDEILFLINDVIGRQFLYSKNPGKAIEYLSRAAELDTKTFDGIRYRTLLELSRAIGNGDAERAAEFAELAVKIAKRNLKEEVSEADLVVAFGEAAVACGFQNDYPRAFDYFDEAYDCIDREFEESPEWKMRVVILGNSLGYFAAMASMGRPPWENYAVPARGGLLGYKKLLAKHYDDGNYGGFDLSPNLLVMFAMSVDRVDRAEYWANKSIEAARAQGVLACIPELAQALIPGLLKQGRIAEALDYALDASTALVATNVARRKMRILDVRASLDAPSLLGMKPNENWNQVDEYFTYVGLIPAILVVLLDRNDRTEKLREVNRLCREVSKTASVPGKFVAIADAIEFFLAEGDRVELHKRGLSEVERRHAAGADSHFLLSSFASAAALRDVVVQHAMVAHSIFSKIFEADSSVGRFITDQLLLFWKRALQSQRLQFSSPASLETELQQVEFESYDIKIKKLLRTILRGLSVQPVPSLASVFDWIYR